MEIGTKFEQVKEIEGFPYNRVGEIWEVNRIVGETTVLRNDCLGLGVNKLELEQHFVKYVEPQEQQSVEILDGMKIIRSGKVTVVILPDGNKGVSKCLPQDEYDADKGFNIAYTKAMIKRYKKQLKKLIK